MGDWGNFGKRKAKFGKWPCYAPNLADSGGATQGARSGRFLSKRGDLCVLGVSKGLRGRLEKVSRAGKDVG